MTERSVVYRVGIDGGRVVKQELDGIGKAGELSHERIVTGAKAASRETARLERSVAAERRAFQSLKASVDPAYAAQQRLARVQDQLNRAVSMGVVEQREAAQVMQLVEARTRGVASAMELTDTSVRGANMGLRNASMQLSQVAQQGAATGNYLQALAIQAPDLALGFGAIGIAAGALIPILYGVAQGFLGAEEAAEDVDLRGAFSTWRSGIEEAEAAQDRYTMAISATGAMQGRITPEILRALGLEASARQALADLQSVHLERQRIAAREALTAAQTEFDALMERATRQPDITVDAAIENGNPWLITQALKARYDAEQQVLENNRELVMEIKEQEATLALVDAQLALVSEDAREVMTNLEEAAEGGGRLESALSRIDISGVGAQAAFLAQQMGIAASEATRYNAALNRDAGLPVAEQRGLGFGLEGSTLDDPMLPGYNRLGFGNLDDPAAARRPIDRTSPVVSSRGGGGGGARAAASVAEGAREAERVMREVEKATVDAMSATERYQHEVRELRELHDEGYLSAEQYGRAVEMMTRDFERARIDEIRDGVQGLTEQLLRAGIAGEDLGQILRNFLLDAAIKAAAEQLSMSIARMAESAGGAGAGGGGLFSIIGRLFSFDGGGYTGNAPRTGGLDGKGGFLAMMHPREEVNDLTRGQGGGVVRLQTQIINYSGASVREENVVRSDGSRLQRFVIADMVGSAQAQRGGAARRQLEAAGVRGPMVQR